MPGEGVACIVALLLCFWLFGRWLVRRDRARSAKLARDAEACVEESNARLDRAREDVRIAAKVAANADLTDEEWARYATLAHDAGLATPELEGLYRASCALEKEKAATLR
jgi:hypothetical protein